MKEQLKADFSPSNNEEEKDSFKQLTSEIYRGDKQDSRSDFELVDDNFSSMMDTATTSNIEQKLAQIDISMIEKQNTTSKLDDNTSFLIDLKEDPKRPSYYVKDFDPRKSVTDKSQLEVKEIFVEQLIGRHVPLIV